MRTIKFRKPCFAQVGFCYAKQHNGGAIQFWTLILFAYWSFFYHLIASINIYFVDNDLNQRGGYTASAGFFCSPLFLFFSISPATLTLAVCSV